MQILAALGGLVGIFGLGVAFSATLARLVEDLLAAHATGLEAYQRARKEEREWRAHQRQTAPTLDWRWTKS